MTLTLFGIKACDTMVKARKWLEADGRSYVFHDYKTQGISADQLESWADQVGWEALLNRSGTTFRKLPEGDRLDLTRDKAISLMLAQPSMIKRPVLEGAGPLLVGFKPEEYVAAFSTLAGQK
jgi:Spx/MgsR family transcriptional regulator